MKTVREYLESIADPDIRERALRNIEKTKRGAIKGRNIAHAIDMFDWDESPEGYGYWYRLFNNPPKLIGE